MPEILTGPKGGKYWIDDKGRKHYIRRESPTSSNSKTKLSKTSRKIESKLRRYIGHFTVRDASGEMIDDFNEWCDAYSENQALHEFNSRHQDTSTRRYEVFILRIEDI